MFSKKYAQHNEERQKCVGEKYNKDSLCNEDGNWWVSKLKEWAIYEENKCSNSTRKNVKRKAIEEMNE